MHDFLSRQHWIFDMDGTLTFGDHDFVAIRKELGLPEGVGILEALDAMDDATSAPLRERLFFIERELASASRVAPDALALLNFLADKGATMGVLTRNALELAHLTLSTVGLASFFKKDEILGRECASPKPSPDGVLRLIAGWGASPDDVVVVGDFLFDLQAGRAAGAGTVLIDREGHGHWGETADVVVNSLDTLIS